jgi:hypothetical protein
MLDLWFVGDRGAAREEEIAKGKVGEGGGMEVGRDLVGEFSILVVVDVVSGHGLAMG